MKQINASAFFVLEGHVERKWLGPGRGDFRAGRSGLRGNCGLMVDVHHGMTCDLTCPFVLQANHHQSAVNDQGRPGSVLQCYGTGSEEFSHSGR